MFQQLFQSFAWICICIYIHICVCSCTNFCLQRLTISPLSLAKISPEVWVDVSLAFRYFRVGTQNKYCDGATIQIQYNWNIKPRCVLCSGTQVVCCYVGQGTNAMIELEWLDFHQSSILGILSPDLKIVNNSNLTIMCE